MDQMHEIDLKLNDLRKTYLLPAPLWHCTFAFTHDFLSLAQFLRVLRECCGILHSTARASSIGVQILNISVPKQTRYKFLSEWKNTS